MTTSTNSEKNQILSTNTKEFVLPNFFQQRAKLVIEIHSLENYFLYIWRVLIDIFLRKIHRYGKDTYSVAASKLFIHRVEIKEKMVAIIGWRKSSGEAAGFTLYCCKLWLWIAWISTGILSPSHSHLMFTSLHRGKFSR